LKDLSREHVVSMDSACPISVEGDDEEDEVEPRADLGEEFVCIAVMFL